MIVKKRERFSFYSGSPVPGTDINQYLDHRYITSNSLNESSQKVSDGDSVDIILDEIGGQNMNWSLSEQENVIPLHFSGEKPRYREILKGVQIHNETGPRWVTNARIGEMPFPRYTFIVGYQAKFCTYEANFNPQFGKYGGDFGNTETRYNVDAGAAGRLGKGFPIRQLYFWEIIETLSGENVTVEEWFNGVKTNGTAVGIPRSSTEQGRPTQGNPVHQMGANTNNPNWAFVDMGIKYGSIPDISQRNEIRLKLAYDYGAGRINLPLAENLTATKSGSIYTASYSFVNPRNKNENIANRYITWIIWKGSVQSAIKFEAVKDLITWSSVNYPIPDGYTVRGVQVIVYDVDGFFCPVPEMENISNI